MKTYGEVLEQYEFHPESKCAEANGDPCEKQTVGLLQRRYVQVKQIKYIGKESNSLEEVDAGTAHSTESVYTEYIDPRRDEWKTKISPALKKARLIDLERECVRRLSRELIELREERSRPRPKAWELLVKVLKKLDYLKHFRPD